MPNLKRKQYKIKPFNAPKRQPRGTWTPLTFPNCGQPTELGTKLTNWKTGHRPLGGDPLVETFFMQKQNCFEMLPFQDGERLNWFRKVLESKFKCKLISENKYYANITGGLWFFCKARSLAGSVLLLSGWSLVSQCPGSFVWPLQYIACCSLMSHTMKMKIYNLVCCIV